jgi:hypothetical protein
MSFFNKSGSSPTTQLARQILLYGILPNGGCADRTLVFIPLSHALRLGAIRDALSAKTWGEFESKMPPEDYASVMEIRAESVFWSSFEEYCDEDDAESDEERISLWHEYLALGIGERPPMPPDCFEPSQVPGHDDGDWPDWVEQEMLDWLPDSIVKKFGEVKSTFLNGPFLLLDINRTSEIVAALEDLGYECHLSADFVCRACGYDKHRQVRQ